MTKITYIPGEIANAAIDEHGNRKPVTRTQHIFDDALGKPQSEVNQDRIEDIAAEIQRAQGAESTLDDKIGAEKTRAEGVESGLNTRLQTVEQLAEISIGGGDAQIATGADFTNPDATKRAKIPTVGAIVDGLNDGIYDVSKRNPTGGPNSDGKFTLEYILSNANTLIPTGWRHGGMSIKFVQSSDNMYVQFRYRGTEVSGTPNPFLNTDNWYKDFVSVSHNTINVNDKDYEIATDKVEIESINLIDDSKLLNNYGLTTNGTEASNETACITDYIKVKHHNIISNAYFSTIWMGAIYSKDKTFIRELTTAQYTYQDGDYFIRLTYPKSTLNKMANYGTTLLNYVEFNPINSYLGGLHKDIGILYEQTAVKVDNMSVNLVNPDTITNNKMIDANGNVVTENTGFITDYIPINGKDIISNAYGSSYWSVGNVYDANKVLLRTIGNTTQYTYQDGDMYVRLSFQKGNEKRANYGTVLLPYSDYNPIEGYINEIETELLTKVEENYINLVDIKAMTLGKGFYPDGTIHDNPDLKLSDYIPVNGKDIISSASPSSIWCSAVYNKNKNLIRTIQTSQYTYVDGDYYVRFSFWNEIPRANYGTILLPYTEYNPIEGYLSGRVEVATVNLIQSFVDDGKGIDINGNIVSEGTLHITDYIKVNAQNVISNAWHNSYWSAGNVYDINKQYLRTIGDTAQYTYQEGDYYVRLSFLKAHLEPMANYGTVLQEYSSYNPIRKYREDIDETLTKIDIPFEVADGNRQAFGSYESELEASPVVNSPANAFIGYKTGERQDKRGNDNINIIAVNHDDLNMSDYVGTRKIYNKYGFNANFNFILLPFENADEQKKMIENVRKLVADGNDLGLHAILDKSYWWMNKCFDIRPDSSFTFAPTLQDIQGDAIDHTGTNAFGQTITATTTVADIGFDNLPTAELRQLKVVEMSATDMVEVIRCFSIYGDYQYTRSGLDLEGNIVSKSTLGWLEYWYNNLIDDTLGYSSTSNVISERFAADYSGTYPSKSEIMSGDITSNGIFTKGLFKGCQTCCNYEVTDRCIEVATAFIKYYFGVNKFTNFGRHGVGSYNIKWKDNQTGFPYENSDKTILTFEGYKTYNTRKKCWESEFDVLLSKGIKITNHTNPLNAILEGQIGLYFGQKNNRADFFTHATAEVGGTGFWNMFGTNVSEDYSAMSYSDFSTFLNGVDNWLKFAYENAGKTITRNSKTFTVFDNIKHAIDTIRACKDTGIIPFFTEDTIKNNPAIATAVDLILRYCYTNNYQVVPVEKAREIVSSRSLGLRSNYFPNDAFNQSILNFFDGDSTAIGSKVPDGWHTSDESALTSVVVDTQTIQDENMRVLNIVSDTVTTLSTKIYGLPSGKYKFSFIGKSTGADAAVSIYKKRNKDYILKDFEGINRYNALDIKYLNSIYTLYEVEFEIEAPHKNSYDGTNAVNVICQGYEDNVANITIELYVQSDISIAKPSIVSI